MGNHSKDLLFVSKVVSLLVGTIIGSFLVDSAVVPGLYLIRCVAILLLGVALATAVIWISAVLNQQPEDPE